jgi:acetyl-CoA carboxylase carboxyltransferase component
MDMIKSTVDKSSENYQKNLSFHMTLAEEFKNRLAQVKEAGGVASVEKHRKRGKLLARERIEKIIDEGSSLLN